MTPLLSAAREESAAQGTTAWVVVDLQRAFESPITRSLAVAVVRAVRVEPGPVFALVQHNPPDGPLHRLRSWHGACEPASHELLPPLEEIVSSTHHKTGYGAATPLPLATLCGFDRVLLAGADTDACVLATALALFDAGVSVFLRADLCASAAGEELHSAAIAILRRQLGHTRVLGCAPGSETSSR